LGTTAANGDRQAREVPFDRKASLLNPAIAIAEMAKQAGGIAICKVLGQTNLHIADAALAARVQYDRDEYFCRSRQQKQLNQMFGTGLLTEDAGNWQQLHDSVNNTFTRKNFNGYHGPILDCIDANILRMSPPGRDLELRLGYDTISWSVAIISTVLLGKRFSDAMIENFLDAFLQGEGRATDQERPQPRIQSSFKRLLHNMQLSSSKVERLLEAPVQAALGRSPLEGRNLLLDVNDELRRESRCPFTQTQHRNLVKTLFMAGIQTSAYTLDWILLLLARHPHHWQRLADVVRPRLQDRELSVELMDQLVSVQHVIYEAMRMRPVIPVIQKGVSKSCALAGVPVNPGDTLNLSVFGIHHSSDYWEDPEVFRPERFLSSPQPQSFTPFGLGQHTCIGQHLAMHVLTTTLIRLVQNYDIAGDSVVSLETESTFLLKPLRQQVIVLRAIA
jgi:cytochrome P450